MFLIYLNRIPDDKILLKLFLAFIRILRKCMKMYFLREFLEYIVKYKDLSGEKELQNTFDRLHKL